MPKSEIQIFTAYSIESLNVVTVGVQTTLTWQLLKGNVYRKPSKKKKRAARYLLSKYITVFQILQLRAVCRGQLISRKNL